MHVLGLNTSRNAICRLYNVELLFKSNMVAASRKYPYLSNQARCRVPWSVQSKNPHCCKAPRLRRLMPHRRTTWLHMKQRCISDRHIPSGAATLTPHQIQTVWSLPIRPRQSNGWDASCSQSAPEQVVDVMVTLHLPIKAWDQRVSMSLTHGFINEAKAACWEDRHCGLRTRSASLARWYGSICPSSSTWSVRSTIPRCPKFAD